jgi:hypothetical protein
MVNNYTNAEMADRHSCMVWQTAIREKNIIFTKNDSLAIGSWKEKCLARFLCIPEAVEYLC